MSKIYLKKTKLKIKVNLPIFTTIKISKLKSSSNILKNYLNSSKNIFSTKTTINSSKSPKIFNTNFNTNISNNNNNEQKKFLTLSKQLSNYYDSNKKYKSSLNLNDFNSTSNKTSKNKKLHNFLTPSLSCKNYFNTINNNNNNNYNNNNFNNNKIEKINNKISNNKIMNIKSMRNEMYKIKLKLRRILHKKKPCKKFEKNLLDFNFKFYEYLSSPQFNKQKKIFNSNFHFVKNELGYSHNIFNQLLNLDYLNNSQNFEKDLNSCLKYEEKKNILSDPNYFLKDKKIINKNFKEKNKSLIERLKNEEEGKKEPILNKKISWKKFSNILKKSNYLKKNESQENIKNKDDNIFNYFFEKNLNKFQTKSNFILNNANKKLQNDLNKKLIKVKSDKEIIEGTINNMQKEINNIKKLNNIYIKNYYAKNLEENDYKIKNNMKKEFSLNKNKNRILKDENKVKINNENNIKNMEDNYFINDYLKKINEEK